VDVPGAVTRSGISVSHIFDTPGTYEVLLGVSAGLDSTTDTVVVTVMEPASEDGLVVEVRGGGSTLAGADVLVIRADGSRLSTVTDGQGRAVLRGLDDGPVTAYVYAPGFQPVAVPADVVGGAASVTVTLVSGEIGLATLDSRRLGIDEIEALGIDPTDPDNQNIFEANVNLYFVPEADVVDENPVRVIVFPDRVACVGGCVAVGGGGGGGGGNVESSPGCDVTNPQGECFLLAGGNSYWPSIDVVEGEPLIQWLVIPIKASFLKEFFEVKMIVQNLTTSFTFEQGAAQLTLPRGLSLAPTSSPQDEQVPVDVIAPQDSHTITWVVRGDVEGDYDLAATYSSSLEPIGRPVQLAAATREPLKVWGGSALKLIVEVDDRAGRWAPYGISLTLENVSDISVYNAALEVLERPANAPEQWAEYFFSPADDIVGLVRTHARDRGGWHLHGGLRRDARYRQRRESVARLGLRTELHQPDRGKRSARDGATYPPRTGLQHGTVRCRRRTRRRAGCG
jgi:PKD repeat protein